MKKADLADQLRQQQYEYGQAPKVVIASLTDDDIIECYTTCSCCGERWMSDSALIQSIEASQNEDEFLGILKRDPKTLFELAERWAGEYYPQIVIESDFQEDLIGKCHKYLAELDERERLYIYSPSSLNQVFEVGSEPGRMALAAAKLTTVSHEGGMIFVGDFKDGVEFRPLFHKRNGQES